MSDQPQDLPVQSAPEHHGEPAIVRVLENFVHDIFGGSGGGLAKAAHHLMEDVSNPFDYGNTCGTLFGPDFFGGPKDQSGKNGVDKVPTADDGKLSAMNLSDRGPIKNIVFPDGWTPRETKSGSARSQESYGPPGDKDVSISVFSSAVTPGDRSAQAFLNLLEDKPADQGRQKLTPHEISVLADIMGRQQAGDNQFTSTGKYRPPAFHLADAYTMQVNGRTVLAVEGNFVDKDGKVTNGFTGIFADTDGTGRRVQQVFMQAAPGKLRQYEKQFADTLASIEWKPA